MNIVIFAFYASLLGAAGFYDLWKFRIPNILVASLAILFLVAALKSYDTVPWLHHLGAGALMFALGIAVYSFGFLGGGDVKLLGATSLWMGFEFLPQYVFFVAIAGGVLALALIPVRRIVEGLVVRFAPRPELVTLPRVLIPGESVPYGVAISAGALPVMFSMPLLGAS